MKVKFEPKLNSIVDSNALAYQVIEFMRRFALENGYFDKNSGCHICLSFNQPKPNGYVRLSADDFYKINMFGDIFLENFKNLKNYYIET